MWDSVARSGPRASVGSIVANVVEFGLAEIGAVEIRDDTLGNVHWRCQLVVGLQVAEALHLRERAVELKFAIMVGCMVGSSLAMAPAMLLAQGADFVDLDGPLLLARDRTPALRYDGSTVSPPENSLWG